MENTVLRIENERVQDLAIYLIVSGPLWGLLNPIMVQNPETGRWKMHLHAATDPEVWSPEELVLWRFLCSLEGWSFIDLAEFADFWAMTQVGAECVKTLARVLEW